MASTEVPSVVLCSSSGKRSMPVIGLGTAVVSAVIGSTKQAILEAIQSDYRHFDTATAYATERPLGDAIAEALQLGLIESRDEVFITSKLWLNENHPHLVISSIKKSLGELQLEYLDLYMIHWPMSINPERPAYPVLKEDLVSFDLKGVWTAMEECQKLGLTKSIGVCNFSRKKLEDLLSFAVIPPSVNQVELNPKWQQKKLLEFCKEKGIVVTAYSPLGAKGVHWGTNEVMDNELLKEIADAHRKTVAQVCLRWAYEQGAAFVVKSYNIQRMTENLQLFDWSLTKDDHSKISQIKQHRINNGPTKCAPEHLWEGEDN